MSTSASFKLFQMKAFLSCIFVILFSSIQLALFVWDMGGGLRLAPDELHLASLPDAFEPVGIRTAGEVLEPRLLEVWVFPHRSGFAVSFDESESVLGGSARGNDGHVHLHCFSSLLV